MTSVHGNGPFFGKVTLGGVLVAVVAALFIDVASSGGVTVEEVFMVFPEVGLLGIKNEGVIDVGRRGVGTKEKEAGSIFVVPLAVPLGAELTLVGPLVCGLMIIVGSVGLGTRREPEGR